VTGIETPAFGAFAGRRAVTRRPAVSRKRRHEISKRRRIGSPVATAIELSAPANCCRATQLLAA
jgi:hypothetical protein